MTRKCQEEENEGEGGKGEDNEESVEINIFPFGFREIPNSWSEEGGVLEVERGGAEEAADAQWEKEDEGCEMGG